VLLAGTACLGAYESARFRSEDTSFDVFADLLVWCAQESGTDNWAEVITGGSTAPVRADIRDVRFDWDIGFRVGLNYGVRHDQWDIMLYYTGLRTSGSDSVSSVPNSVYSAFLGNFYVDNASGAGIRGLAYQQARLHWVIDFNIFDWEVGRSCRVGKAVSLRPFLGLKGGWIDQRIHSTWHNPTLPPAPPTFEPFNEGRENLKNNFWGVGPSAGLNTKWALRTRKHHSFSLFGDFSGAIMYGHWTFSDVYKNDIQQEVIVKLADVNSAATMMRMVMGLGWDASSRNAGFRFEMKLGYEMQFWLNQLQPYIFDAGRLGNVLTLQGGTLECCFDF
jgi:hypothetical protein